MEEKEIDAQNEKLLKFVCPVCKAEKKLPISKSMISQEKNLTTVSIQKNEICEHHFQAFIDKNFRIRGYQKVDFEIDTKKRLPKGDYIMKVIITKKRRRIIKVLKRVIQALKRHSRHKRVLPRYILQSATKNPLIL